MMMKLNNYNDYRIDVLLESIKNDETILIISDKLCDILKLSTHPIAKKLLEYNYDWSFKFNNFKITLLDLDDNETKLDDILFMNSNKAIQYITNELGITLNKDKKLDDNEKKLIYNKLTEIKNIKIKNKSKTSLGRIINKLFFGEFDPNKDIEPFVNEFKQFRDTTDFEIVNGKDIIYWYNGDNYINMNGPLGSSCMAHEECSNYIKFYSENPEKVSLLILKDKDDGTKIRGRSIIWKLDFPENRIFMDRIYYTTDHIVELFKKYAVDNGWLYKKDQNMEESEIIVDEKNNTNITKIKVNELNDTGWGYYPYMDTLKYFNGTELSNEYTFISKKDKLMKLSDTNGGTYNEPGNNIDDDEYYDEYYDSFIYSEYYGRNISTYDCRYCEKGEDYRYEEDCFYSKYYDSYITNGYADYNMLKCDYYELEDDRYRESDDYVKLYNGKISTKEYFDKHPEINIKIKKNE